MVAIAFSLAAPSLGLAGAGIGLGAAVAGVGFGLFAAYLDSRYVLPSLFGKAGGPKPEAIEGFQLSTTDPGAPRWEVFGSRAWVPCHYMWTRGITEEVSGNGQTGKGGKPFTQTLRADVGLATCDGAISLIEAMYADEQPFWARDLARVGFEDFRWRITAGTGGFAGMLVIEATEVDVDDFYGLLRANMLVKLDGVLPVSIEGYYRVYEVRPHSGATKSRVVLVPLRSQTPVTGSAGSMFDPAKLIRITTGCASSTWNGLNWVGNSMRMNRLAGDPTIPGRPEFSIGDLQRIWVINAIYRFDGLSPAAANGLFKLRSRNDFGNVYTMIWDPMEGQVVSGTITAGTPTVPSIITREITVGFVFPDPAAMQSAVEYVGTDSQPQDPTLVAHEANAPAHRGIAHMSLSRWNLGPHGNRFPYVKAMVCARVGESVAMAVDRICARVVPNGTVDTSRLRPRMLLGYSVPGGMPRGQALQPLMIMYGIAVQDRGGVLTFMDERDLPVVPVATRHLNANSGGAVRQEQGFVASRIDRSDVPERVILHYIDPTNEGANSEEADGVRAPGSPDRGGQDTLDVDLRPLVAWPFEVKRRARELRRKAQLETYRGHVDLPPGYMDVLAAHCITFVSNNHEFERMPAGATISYSTALRDLVRGSIAIEVLFSTSGRARLVDNGAGVLEGFPAGVTASVNSVNYDTGQIALTCSESLDSNDEPSIRYRYARQWFMRANKASLRGHDFSIGCDLVTATTDDPLPPVPRDLATGIGAPIVSRNSLYQVEVLDVPAIYPGSMRTVSIWFVATPLPGSAWRGATVFQSPNGTDRWVAVGTIQTQTTIGSVVGDGLSPGGASVVDWETELTVDLPLGEQLVGATLEQIGFGQNLALVGDEIIGFLEVEPDVDTTWILRGIVRGLRGTVRAMDTHVGDGERFVLLFGLGWMSGFEYTPQGGFAAANRTYYWRVVPGGASITAVGTITTLVRGNSARPAAPILEPDDMVVDGAGKIALRWWRRAVDETTLFGPTPMPAGEVELYHVLAIDHDQFTALSASLTEDEAILASTRRRWVVGGGDDSIATRSIVYPAADRTADLAVAGGTTIGLLVRQIGAAGHSDRSAILTHS